MEAPTRRFSTPRRLLTLAAAQALLLAGGCRAPRPVDRPETALEAYFRGLATTIPIPVRQIVLVTTDGWDSSTGSLRLYDKRGGRWRPALKPISVALGRNGLGWGRGLHRPTSAGPTKKEGDGRAPAGIFRLSLAFGYAPHPPPGVSMPYKQSTDRDYFIDDVRSPDYNRWVRIAADEPNTPRVRWRSFERMRRRDRLYELGLVVRHNADKPRPGDGSAIFLHIWRGSGKATAGCTAMPKPELLRLLRRLDPTRNPVLVQLPRSSGPLPPRV